MKMAVMFHGADVFVDTISVSLPHTTQNGQQIYKEGLDTVYQGKDSKMNTFFIR